MQLQPEGRCRLFHEDAAMLAIAPAKLSRLFAEKHDGFNVLIAEGI